MDSIALVEEDRQFTDKNMNSNFYHHPAEKTFLEPMMKIQIQASFYCWFLV